MYPIRQIIALILSIFQVLFPFAADWATNGGERLMYEWSETIAFDESYYTEIEKTPGEDFVILNITDVQIYDNEIFAGGGIGPSSLALVERLIEDVRPDLITLSGDCFCSTLATIELVDILESYEIPWAPILGNHDGGNFGEWVFWGAWRLYRAEHSLFEFGPKGMGYGNYILNLTEDGRVIHSFYLMDTHRERSRKIVEGVPYMVYDHLWDNQIAWYEWAVRGNERLAGYHIPSTVIMHVPSYEFLTAWKSVADDRVCPDAPLGYLLPEYAGLVTGHSGEFGGYPPETNGFFDKVKELGSTTDIIAGHDHLNDYSMVYEGIRLSYALHTGFGSYYRDDMLGGTVYTVASDGSTSIRHAYYDYIDGAWVAR